MAFVRRDMGDHREVGENLEIIREKVGARPTAEAIWGRPRELEDGGLTMWRRFAFRIGGLVTGIVSLLGFVWAWSVVPDSLGLEARLGVVGIIGALWMIVVVAPHPRARSRRLRLRSRPPARRPPFSRRSSARCWEQPASTALRHRPATGWTTRQSASIFAAWSASAAGGDQSRTT
jgi:hypothetical protein